MLKKKSLEKCLATQRFRGEMTEIIQANLKEGSLHGCYYDELKWLQDNANYKVECDSTSKLDNFSEMNYFLERCRFLKLS